MGTEPRKETWTDAEQVKFLRNELSEALSYVSALLTEAEGRKGYCVLCGRHAPPLEETPHFEDCVCFLVKREREGQRRRVRERKL